MNETDLSLPALAKIAQDEQVRLAQISDVHPREELEHHVWPFLGELLQNVQQWLERDEAPVPASVAARIAAALGQLIAAAANTLSPEKLAPIVAMAHEAFDELLSFVDPDEWAAIAQEAVAMMEPRASQPAALTGEDSRAPSEPAVSGEIVS